jgi:hypothetical protein
VADAACSFRASCSQRLRGIPRRDLRTCFRRRARSRHRAGRRGQCASSASFLLPLERDVGSCFGLACSAGLNQAGLKAAGVHMHADGSLPFSSREPCESRHRSRVRSHGRVASSGSVHRELVETLKSQMCHRSTCHPHRVEIHGEGIPSRITRAELAPRCSDRLRLPVLLSVHTPVK